ncbi:MAG: hypothetical protein QXX12_01405 [Nanopusillaceae archaeon]
MVRDDIKTKTQELYKELFEYTIYTEDFVNVLNLAKIISLINKNKRYAENLGITKEVKRGKSDNNNVYNEIVNTIKEGYSEVEVLKKLKPNLYIVNQIIENHEEYNRKFKKKIKFIVNKIYDLNIGIAYNIFRKLYKYYSQYFMHDEFKSIIEYGLLESIYRYIHGIGVEFSGVAYNYIKKNIVDEIRNNHFGITGIDYESSHISSYVINPAIQSDKDEDIVIENINENELFELDCKECDIKPATIISIDELAYDDNQKTTKLDIVSYLLYKNDYDDSDIDFNQITLDDVFNILDKYEMLSYLNYIYKTKKIDKNDYKELLSYITKKYKITEKDKLLVRLKESVYLRSAKEKLNAIL